MGETYGPRPPQLAGDELSLDVAGQFPAAPKTAPKVEGGGKPSKGTQKDKRLRENRTRKGK